MPKGNFKEIGISVDSEWEEIFLQYSWASFTDNTATRPLTVLGVYNYITRKHSTKSYSAGALISTCLHLGMLDHIDRNPLNNVMSNLRVISLSDNRRNAIGARGYSYDPVNKNYRVTILANNKKYELGRYLDESSARLAYIKGAITHKVIEYISLTEAEINIVKELLK